MNKIRVRSVMSLSHLEITLPFCDRYCVIECDSENRCYRIPYHFAIAFLFATVASIASIAKRGYSFFCR